jgi:hypothetical protein
MEEDGSAKPVFIAISKEAGRPPPALTDYGLSIGSLAVTSFTAFAYGIGTLALNAQFFDKLAAGDLATAAQAIPVTVGILGLLLVHELAHAVMAKMYAISMKCSLHSNHGMSNFSLLRGMLCSADRA